MFQGLQRKAEKGMIDSVYYEIRKITGRELAWQQIRLNSNTELSQPPARCCVTQKPENGSILYCKTKDPFKSKICILKDKKPTILQQKQAPRKPYRQAITPSPPKTSPGSRNVSRPQTSLGLYNEQEATFDEVLDYSRPKSAFGNNNERVTKVYNINSRISSVVECLTAEWEVTGLILRAAGPYFHPKIYIDNQIKCLNFYHNSHTKFRVPWLESVTACVVFCLVKGNNSTAQTWTVSNSQDKGRSALPRRRTGFNAGALIPGSVSTMVSIPESDDGRSSRSIASPSFQNLLDHDESSDYETDLEEDFPVPKKVFDPSGRNVYHKLCKEEDLVPVSYLSDRFSSKEIVMKHHGLGSQGTLPIAKALIRNTFTEKLDLTDNYIEAAGGVALARMLMDNCFITEINLSENFLRSQGGVAFASMLLKNTSLIKLVLRSNHLSDKDAKAFAEALKENRTLTHLDLSHNEIGEMGGIYLGAGLGMNYGLKHLDLSWNCIRFKGAVGMAQGLKVSLS
ncbi:unnamed protein product [Porites evermanni]|uniref:Uncharacterized protein n=1 Tax=Porites evermanni TaxID=104178 RepID=A0ABN8PIG5_9CNID|nr:unnamed protein product [Porites evermanni]